VIGDSIIIPRSSLCESAKECAVADEASPNFNPFDVQTIRHLVALMSRHDLSEIYLQEGDLRIRLRRGPCVGVGVQAPAATPAVATPAPPSSSPGANDAAKPSKRLHEIKSPVVGTFYSQPKPGEEPYVRVGTRVTATSVVGLIEAMKIYNEITADCAGVITEVLVENQQAVEFGQVLFRVDTAA
jgi:acetyl-CoA carboxylase biotin carboxyl carrier protein